MKLLAPIMLVVMLTGTYAQYMRLLSNQRSIASPELTSKRSKFIEMMKNRVSSDVTIGLPKFSIGSSTSSSVSKPMSTPTTTTPTTTTSSTSTPAIFDGEARMMNDEVKLDPIFQRELQRELNRQKMEQNRLEREQQRIEKENQRIEQEKQRVLADEQNLQRLRDKDHKMEEHMKELDDHMRTQQEKIEEQRIQRENLEKERNHKIQKQLEDQRLAEENRRLAEEARRVEEESLRREKELEKQQEFQRQQEALQEILREQHMSFQEKIARLITVPTKTNETMCSTNPCKNNGDCVDLSNGRYQCKCPWGFSGINCDVKQIVDKCSENPCSDNKVCRLTDISFECVCPEDRVGENCEIINESCNSNPCLNSGVCNPKEDGEFECKCAKPFIGKTCEKVWEHPCTEENLKNTDLTQFKDPWDEQKFIVCTDISLYHSMPCSPGTFFNERIGNCVRLGYNPPICPRNHCKNNAECIMDEDQEFRCVCQKGFAGEFCEQNIDECVVAGGNSACAGGTCVDQLDGFYCECPYGIGFNCIETMPNPCTEEALDAKREHFAIQSVENNAFVHCTGLNKFVVNRCTSNLFWNQELKQCDRDIPSIKTGKCLEYPCNNGGECVDLGDAEFTCQCKPGFTGKTCEVMIDSCESNPCQNGGRCLPHAGGYTCACPDKVIDDCCCHGVKNPCPKKAIMIPGVNNYFPHLYEDRYIHCDFDGRAFTRKCTEGLKWIQSALTCLPSDFVTIHNYQKSSNKPKVLQADLEKIDESKIIETEIKRTDINQTQEPEIIILEADKSMLDLKNKEESVNRDLTKRKNAFIENQKIKTLRMIRPRKF